MNVEATVLGAGFITASHCSVQTFSQDGGSLFQNTVSPANEISWEGSDPIWYPPGQAPCDSTYVGCRYSDAAFMVYLASYGLKGAIARTTGIGSTTVDPNTPTFLISSASTVPFFVGQEVNRVGRSTKWRQCTVTATCVHHHDWDGTGVSLVCQTHSNAIADLGDSGGPAFTWDGSSAYVELAGLTVGVLVVQGNIVVGSIMSPWLFVDWELSIEAGQMDVTY